MIKDTRRFFRTKLSRKRRLIDPPLEVALLDIRSRFNVGSIFRTSDAVGVSKIHLLGYTPAPPHKEIDKVSLGSERTVPFSINKSPIAFIKKMKGRGYTIVGVEITKKSIPYFQFRRSSKRILLLLGNEISGLDRTTLKACDILVKIPMSGIKESLNVGISFGIVAYRLAFP
jgi:23S rRNA (guanosine2251-2'-O)-methyltransferase